jgi:hypothetical protein
VWATKRGRINDDDRTGSPRDPVADQTLDEDGTVEPRDPRAETRVKAGVPPDAKTGTATHP